MESEKALALIGRYTRLRVRDQQCRLLAGRLFDACEDPAYHGDEQVGSGCISSLRDAMKDGALKSGPNGESNWHQLLTDLEFCRPCRLGLRVSNHRKRTLSKRRAAVLGAMFRLGKKVAA